MSLILHIDTSGSDAWVVLAENGRLLRAIQNKRQQDHAGFLHPAIRELLEQSAVKITELTAVAVCAGPGSYTGVRIGMAAGKGLCFSLKIPLLSFNALEITAHALSSEMNNGKQDDLPICYCPMIDARRMEVFTAIYDNSLQEIMPPRALILVPDSYNEILATHRVAFAGSGATKWQPLCVHENAIFTHEQHREQAMTSIAWNRFQRNEFADLINTGPMYIKEFYNGSSSK